MSGAKAMARGPRGASRTLAAAVVAVIAFAALLCVPFVFHSRYIVYLGTLLALQASLAVSLNIVMGFAGQFALAHAAFYGFGAYASAILIRDFDLGFWSSLPPTVCLTALLATCVGYPSMRLTGGIHFALITFAFGELLRLIAANLHDLTGGPQGMQIAYSPAPALGVDFGSARGLYILAATFLVLSLVLSMAIRRSRFGRSLVAIREDEVLAASLGVDVVAHKVSAFVIASVLAALAGAIYAPFISFISPDALSSSDSVTIVGSLIVGGMGTTSGPILGTLVFVALPELLRVAKTWRLALLGVIIVATVLFAPKGLAGIFGRLTGVAARGRT